MAITKLQAKLKEGRQPRRDKNARRDTPLTEDFRYFTLPGYKQRVNMDKAAATDVMPSNVVKHGTLQSYYARTTGSVWNVTAKQRQLKQESRTEALAAVSGRISTTNERAAPGLS